MVAAQRAESRRRGVSTRVVAIVLAAVLVVPLLAWSFWPGGGWAAREINPMTHTVERSLFLNETLERGNVESASNVEIRCEVQSKNLQGTTILEIVPEGTYVQPGDILVRLDKSQLENDRIKQQITCSNSEAALIKARNDHASALIAKREYEEGSFREQEQQILSEISTAQENLRRARDYLKYSERLAVRGYVTQLQLEADRFAVEKAQTDLEVAETKLRVLREFTKAKMLNQLDSAIATTEAAKKAAERSHQLDVEQLQLIETQIERCTIRAPEPGQVVYANEVGSRGGKDIIIQEGEMVRERQVIIRLPDPKRMQVKAKINEARVSMVAPGQRATIRMDAFPDLELVGTVEKVSEYPAPTNFFNPNVKEYETIIKIDQSPPGLRPGLTAEVKILIERIEDTIHVPVQSVFEHAGRHWCVVRGEGGRGWAAREVEVGSTNDKTVVIRKGLEVGEEIVLNASVARDRVDLPAASEANGAGQRGSGGLGRPSRRGPGGAAGPESVPAASGNERGKPIGESAGSEGGSTSNPAAAADALFSQFDIDRDGRIKLSDMPEPWSSRLQGADINGDGQIDRSEFNSAASRMMRHGGEPGAGPADGPRAGRPERPLGPASEQREPGRRRPDARSPGNEP